MFRALRAPFVPSRGVLHSPEVGLAASTLPRLRADGAIQAWTCVRLKGNVVRCGKNSSRVGEEMQGGVGPVATTLYGITKRTLTSTTSVEDERLLSHHQSPCTRL